MPVRFRPLIMMLALAGALVPFRPEPVQAQGLFDTLRSIFGGRGFMVPEEEPEHPYSAYCVRLCDGRFFPLPAAERKDREERGFFFRGHRYREDRPAVRTGGDASPENLCKAMCPATPVRVFTGNGIDQAVSSDGAPYSKLQNAFVYREKMIPECTCNGLENAGLSNLDAESDPTLQPGDIVVTAEGVKIYRGGRGQAALVPVNEARGMPESMRRNLSAIRISRTQEPVTAGPGIPPQSQAPRASSVSGAPSPAEDIMNRGFVP